MKFNFNDKVIIRVPTLEKEGSTSERSSEIPDSSKTPPILNVPSQIPDALHPPDTAGGRGMRVRKETEYVRMLKEGMAVTGQRKGILPVGMREGTVVTSGDDAEAEEHAMATVIESAEGVMPTYEEACKRPDWPKWEEAIRKELASLKKSGTWELVKRPPGANIVDSKWVLRIKKNAAGEIEKYKAHLVAKGFTQIYGVDYYKTYAPVARLSSFQLLLAITARNGWPVDTFDFDSAYLNSKLYEDEVIYMEQPPGYETKDRASWMWRLWKALYGLKQGARNWYQALRKVLEELGFKQTDADHGVFFKNISGGMVIIVAVHVDDGAVTRSSKELISRFKVEMDKKYKLTDLGTANWLLGIKISRDFANKTISLSQHAYIDTIIDKFNFTDLKPSSIPIDPAVPLSKTQCPSKLEDIARMRNIPY